MDSWKVTKEMEANACRHEKGEIECAQTKKLEYMKHVQGGKRKNCAKGGKIESLECN